MSDTNIPVALVLGRQDCVDELLCPHCKSDAITQPSDGEYRCAECGRLFYSSDLEPEEPDLGD